MPYEIFALRQDRTLFFIGPDGDRAACTPSRRLPAPLHLAPLLLGMRHFSFREKIALALGMVRLARVRGGEPCQPPRRRADDGVGEEHVEAAGRGGHLRLRDRRHLELRDAPFDLHPDHVWHLVRLDVRPQPFRASRGGDHAADVVRDPVGIDEQGRRGDLVLVRDDVADGQT